MEDNLFDIRQILGVLRRRWLLLALPIAIGGVLSVLIALLIPPTYRSSALIVVESQQIPTDLARSTVASNAEERVRLIEQRLTTRQNLLDLAQQFDIFAGRDDLSPTERVNAMREAVSIRSQTVSTNRREQTVSTIEIAFEDDTPVVAAQVANTLLSQLLEQNVEQRSTRAAETVDFFNAEVERLGAALDDLESRISAFKNQNQDALPDSLGFRRSELAALQRETFDRRGRRAELEERKQILEQRIELGVVQAESVDQISAEQRELANLRSALAQQKAIYAPTHPTVRSLEARIAALETTVASDNEDVDTAAQPGVGQSIDLVAEIDRIDAELDRLTTQDELDSARISALEGSIVRTPQVEIQLGALEREYDVLQARYNQALVKQAEAETGERLEVNRQAERFEVIEQPQVPDTPISPNRLLIAGAGGVASIALGAGLVILAELLNPALRTPRDLERKLQLRPIATVPYIRTRREELRRRWTVRFLVLLILVLLPLTLFIVDSYVLPLPVIIERIVERTGLEGLLNTMKTRIGG